MGAAHPELARPAQQPGRGTQFPRSAQGCTGCLQSREDRSGSASSGPDNPEPRRPSHWNRNRLLGRRRSSGSPEPPFSVPTRSARRDKAARRSVARPPSLSRELCGIRAPIAGGPAHSLAPPHSAYETARDRNESRGNRRLAPIPRIEYERSRLYGDEETSAVIADVAVAGLDSRVDLEAGAAVIAAEAAGLDACVDLEAGAAVIAAEAAGLDSRVDLEAGAAVIGAEAAGLDPALTLRPGRL